MMSACVVKIEDLLVIVDWSLAAVSRMMSGFGDGEYFAAAESYSTASFWAHLFGTLSFGIEIEAEELDGT